MFKLSGKLRTLSIVFVILGAIGVIYGFISTPSDLEEAEKTMVAQQQKEQNKFIDEIQEDGFTQRAVESAEKAEFSDKETKVEKTLHQLRTRPWAATFTAGFFFLMLALGTLVFQAFQYASEAGWSPVLFRVFEGITNYLLPGSILVAIIVLFAGTNFYPWQNAELVAEDEILGIKSLYLNMPFFVIRLIIYLVIWNGYRYYQRQISLEEADPTDYGPYKRNYNLSIWFLILFGATEATMGWDWFMSMTPHWYSALYSWYILSGILVAAMTTIALVTIYLKNKGLLEFVNSSHIHDLAKYMFAFSIFWAYLWFAQFMLIWYANIPEEAAYFVMQIQHYEVLFFGMLVFNFILPFLLLMDVDFKRIPWLINLVGILILVGQYIAVYLMVIPNTMGRYGYFGIPEIGAILFFLGLFIFVVGTGLGKVHLRPSESPLLKESENYQY